MSRMAARPLIPLLVFAMLLTGVTNILIAKYQVVQYSSQVNLSFHTHIKLIQALVDDAYQDKQCVRNCHDPDASRHVTFQQPVIQTLQMFIAEVGCWLLVAWRRIYTHCYPNPTSKHSTFYAGHGQGYSALATRDSADLNEADRRAMATALIRASDGAEVLAAAPEHGERRGHNGRALEGVRILWLALPAVLDICGTTLMNTGLLLVAPSIYQMTRGSLVLFVGLLSVVVLRQKLQTSQWCAILGVVVGVFIVGLAGAIAAKSGDGAADGTASGSTISGESLHVVIGVCLVAGAQIFVATQFVAQEWILWNSDLEPVHVVGWEGIFGFLLTVSAMAVLHLLVGRTEAGRMGPFDIVEGWRQFHGNRAVFVSGLLLMVNIGLFNLFGLLVTRHISATSRSTIDTSRTFFIWLISLALGWESFKFLQLVGLTLLVYCTLLFHGTVEPLWIPDLCAWMSKKEKMIDGEGNHEAQAGDPRVHGNDQS